MAIRGWHATLSVELVKTPAQEWTDRHLDTWCAWKHGWSGPDGYPDQAQGLENYTTIDHGSERAYEKLDAWIAETVQVVIDGIGERHPAQKAALYRAYDIVAAFQFPRGNYEGLLRAAKANVTIGLRRRQVWLGE